MSSSTKSSGTILIVDDQEKNIQVVGTTLAAFKYDIMVATSGEQALSRVESRIPDLILLDIIMPGMDGFEVCAALKKIPEAAEIPIIFLSATDDKNIIVRALESGGVDFVTKPFNKAELIARVRTHLELKQTREALEELIIKREEFIGLMAHDLKNPLSGIQFSSQLLGEMKDDLPDKASSLAENITQATGRALILIEQFLADIRESQSEIEVKLEATDLTEIIAESVDRFRPAADRKSITIDWEKPDNQVNARVDKFGAARLLDNLLSNAVKFSPEGKSIVVNLDPKTREVSIQDEGPGIPEKDRELLFEQFTRLSAKPTGGETSTGLGLSISQRLAELMDASISVDPFTPGEGSNFRIKFAAEN